MARLSRRIFDGTAFDLFEDLSRPLQRFTRLTFEFLALAPANVDDVPPRVPLSSGFTDKNDFVHFDSVQPGTFTTSYYDALNGNDYVYLPSTKAKADAIGYDPSKVFYGNGGDDVVIGQGLNDLIDGGRGKDSLYGGAGNDTVAGFTGNDKVFGGAGDDLLAGGTGFDDVHGGDGNDVILNTEPDDPAGSTDHDHVYGDAGDDMIAATPADFIGGGDGDDLIWIFGSKEGYGAAHGDNGNDVIIGSQADDWIWTGPDLLFAPPESWTPQTEALYGGFHDKVDSGDGNDLIITMAYCEAEVSTGKGEDEVSVHGKWDTVAMGLGNDIAVLHGGAGIIDLGEGDDAFVMSRPSYDNPNTSLITLGAGADRVVFGTDEWFSHPENLQPLEDAPLVLDFDHNKDVIWLFEVTNTDDANLSLNPKYIKTIDILGGGAIIYDSPVDIEDFCFAKFSGVTAEVLAANILQHASYV